MATEGRIRASDADRDRIAAALREHLAAGRLTTAEFEERLDKAYAAKTLGELDDLMADLPEIDLEGLPGTSLDRAAGGRPSPGQRSGGPVEARPGRFSPARRAAWESWLGISLLLFVIWVVSGAGGSLWLLWVPALLGALLLRRWIMRAPGRSEHNSAGPRRNYPYRDSG